MIMVSNREREAQPGLILGMRSSGRVAFMIALVTAVIAWGCSGDPDDPGAAAPPQDVADGGTDAAPKDTASKDTASKDATVVDVSVPDSGPQDVASAFDTATVDATVTCECGDGICNAECGEALTNCPLDCAVCGDGTCTPGESPKSCKPDCCGACGDGLCKGYECGENSTTCKDDCGNACGNKVCDKGENPTSCAEDCKWQVCGNGVCEPEDGGPQKCPDDCGTACGNCVCDKGESWLDCPVDCGYCGDGICSTCVGSGESVATCKSDCESDMCKASTGASCDDGIDCTADLCTSKGGCLHIAAEGACDDGIDCTKDACDAKAGCTHASDPTVCVDSDPCTEDACDPKKGCVTLPATGTACDDGDPCTADDACVAGKCQGVSSCACKQTADCQSKEDGDACNGKLVCVAGACVVDPKTVVTCDAQGDTACKKNTCAPQTGACAPKPVGDGTACDDGSQCTGGDACGGGACTGIAKSCDDGNPCTTDGCDAVTGKCTAVPGKAGVACDDGLICTEGDVCGATGSCAGKAKSCDDGLPCTADTCDAGTGKCKSAPGNDGVPCNDGKACTGQDKCASGTCAGQPTDCTDSNPCTDDACVEPFGNCKHTPSADGGACDDGLACTEGDACKGGKCQPTKSDCPCKYSSECNDGDACTTDLCDGGTKKCTHTAILCDDKKPCTADACDPKTGKCGFTPDDKADPGVTSCFVSDCGLGKPVCKGGEVACEAAGPDPKKNGALCNGGEGTCDTGVCLQNFAPVIVSASITPSAVKPGASPQLVVVVADENSDAGKGVDDIATVFADLSKLGGSAKVALNAGTTPTPKSRSYSAAVATTGVGSGSWLVPVTATDKAGRVATATAALLVTAGNVVEVGPGKANGTIAAGMAAAKSGDVLMLDPGTYAGSGNKMISPAGKVIAVVGKGGAAATTIDCGGAGRAFNLSNPGGTAELSLAGLTIQNCAASAVRVVTANADQAKLTVANSVITGNNNGGAGGAILAEGPGTQVVAVQTAFTSNTAKSGQTKYEGGAIRVLDATLTLDGCAFSGNEGSYGAAVSLAGKGKATIEGCSFTGHKNADYVVYGSSTDTAVTVTRSTFKDETTAEKCLAGNGGGGSLTVSESRFDGCKIAVIGFSGKPCNVSASVFKNSSGNTSYWGVVSFCNVTSSIFSGNKNTAYSMTGSGNTIESSTFVGNNAGYASFLVKTIKSMSGCTFADNQGGTLVDASGSVTDCVFTGNTATTAVLYAHSAVTVKDCRFDGNTSPNGGGLKGTSGNKAVLSNLLVTNNTATKAGGGVYLYGGNWTVDNLTVVGNTAPLGGGLFVDGAKALVRHSIFWDNIAADATGKPEGAQLYFNNASATAPTLQFNAIRDNPATVGGDVADAGIKVNNGDGFAVGQAGNIGANPLFVTGKAGAWYLSQLAAGQAKQSPCVDPKDAAGLTAPLAAAAGFDKVTTRTDGVGDTGTLDMGYHFKP